MFLPSSINSELQSAFSGNGSNSIKYTLLEKGVGPKCLACLLGIGRGRLGRTCVGAPDLRYGKKVHESKAGTWSVDAFLQVSYDAVAETLPDRFLNRMFFKS